MLAPDKETASMAKTQGEISFKVSNTEFDLIQKIADRAMADQKKHRHPRDCRKRQDIVMDITAVHANGNPLRLADLLEADDFNFAHDVCGIENCLNRETAELENFFSPRFSQRTSAKQEA
jgi:hypothetical protein